MASLSPYLRRCLDLAALPGAAVEPNPRVGAVIVENDEIIGEGYHRQFGGAHAEVEAVNDALQRGNGARLAQACIYVSLEPCNFRGKTPACSALILKHHIPKVVIGSLDPNPKVSGKSAAMLRTQGVEVEVVEDQQPFIDLNRHFWRNQGRDRPYITLKWAQSADGFIAAHDAQGLAVPTAISSPAASRYVHRLRHEHQAILVGARTLAIDNPSLTTRKWPGRDPLRIVVLGKNAPDADRQLFSGGPTVVVSERLREVSDSVRMHLCQDLADLPDWVSRLYGELEIGSILVEGGAFTHAKFLEADLWDEIVIDHGQSFLGGGLAAPIPAGDLLSDCLVQEQMMEGDLVRRYLRPF